MSSKKNVQDPDIRRIANSLLDKLEPNPFRACANLKDNMYTAHSASEIAEKRAMLAADKSRKLHPFWSPKLSLQNADIEFEKLVSEVRVMGASDVNATVIEFDPNSRIYSHKLIYLIPIPDSVVIAFNNAWGAVREALDQTVYAAGVASGASNNKLDALYFPFAGSLGEFLMKIREKTTGIRAEIIPLIENARTYKGGNDPLWAVGRVTNKKKHARLAPFASLYGYEGEFADTDRMIKLLQIDPPNAEKGEMEFARYISEDGNPFEIKAAFIQDIVVDGIEAIKHRPILKMSRGVIDDARTICLNIEAKCVELGLISDFIDV